MNLKQFLILVSIAFLFVGCSKDDTDEVNANMSITTFKLTAPAARTGVIDNTAKTVSFQPFEPKTDLTKVVIEITLASSATISTESKFTFNSSNELMNFMMSVMLTMCSAFLFIRALSENSLSGPIPTYIGNLFNITGLYVKNSV